MATVRIKTAWNLGKKLEASKSQLKAYQNEVGTSVVSEMKQFIARGQSPVYDEGRFVPYKNKDKYPGDLKPSKPVNLYLSGKMLRDIKFEPKGESGVYVGLITDSLEIEDRFKTHQEGLNGVPRRRFLPVGPGEQFAVKIQRTIRKIQEIFLDDLIKKLNK